MFNSNLKDWIIYFLFSRSLPFKKVKLIKFAAFKKVLLLDCRRVAVKWFVNLKQNMVWIVFLLLDSTKTTWFLSFLLIRSP